MHIAPVSASAERDSLDWLLHCPIATHPCSEPWSSNVEFAEKTPLVGKGKALATCRRGPFAILPSPFPSVLRLVGGEEETTSISLPPSFSLGSSRGEQRYMCQMWLINCLFLPASRPNFLSSHIFNSLHSCASSSAQIPPSRVSTSPQW